MAKYYLGRNEDGLFVPIIMEHIGPNIKEVIEYTTSFAHEDELRESLLANKKIKYFIDELAYVKETGTKDNRTYEPIYLGKNICTATSKRFFDANNLIDYCNAKIEDANLYRSLMLHYIQKFKVADILFDKIKKLVDNRHQATAYLINLYGLENNVGKIARDTLAKLQSMSDDELAIALERIAYHAITDAEVMFRTYHFFRSTLDLNYTRIIDLASRVYSMIKARENMSQDIKDRDRADILKVVDNLLELALCRRTTRREEGSTTFDKSKIYDRSLVDLGLFLSSYQVYEDEIRYRYYRDEKTTQENDPDRDGFLDESDFRRMNTTSSREGITLVKRDKDNRE